MERLTLAGLLVFFLAAIYSPDMIPQIPTQKPFEKMPHNDFHNLVELKNNSHPNFFLN